MLQHVDNITGVVNTEGCLSQNGYLTTIRDRNSLGLLDIGNNPNVLRRFTTGTNDLVVVFMAN